VQAASLQDIREPRLFVEAFSFLLKARERLPLGEFF
jgi:hypothetical protein